jgi:hypothetical protein
MTEHIPICVPDKRQIICGVVAAAVQSSGAETGPISPPQQPPSLRTELLEQRLKFRDDQRDRPGGNW